MIGNVTFILSKTELPNQSVAAYLYKFGSEDQYKVEEY